MAYYYARSNEQLNELIANSEAEDTIYLAAGLYDPVTIRNLGTLDITIAALDQDNPPVVTGLRVSGSNGIVFSGLVFEAGEGDRNAFTVSGSDDVHFSGVVVRGPNNIGSGEEVSPFMIRSSTNVSVTDSEFYQVKNALALLDVDGIVVSGNSFHDVRCDGVRGGGVSNAVISNNVFMDFYPIDTGGSGDHPDAIQFWSTAQDEPGRNITISDNLIYRGDGLPMQGIFIRDTYNNLPFENLTITGNVVLGGLYNGISVGGVTGGELANNIVIAMDDQRSWIRVGADTDFAIENNFASRYSAYNRDTPYDESNLTIEGGTDFMEAALSAWSAAGSDLLADLRGILLGDVRPDLIPNGDEVATSEPVLVETVPESVSEATPAAPTGTVTEPAEPVSEPATSPAEPADITPSATSESDPEPASPVHEPGTEPPVMQPITVIHIPTPTTLQPPSGPLNVRDFDIFGGFGEGIAASLNLGVAPRFFNPLVVDRLRTTELNESGASTFGADIALRELFTLQSTHSMNSSERIHLGGFAPAMPNHQPSEGSLVQDAYTAFELNDGASALEHGPEAEMFGGGVRFAPHLDLVRSEMLDLAQIHIV